VSCQSISTSILSFLNFRRLQKAFSVLFPNGLEAPTRTPSQPNNEIKNEVSNRFAALGDLLSDAVQAANIEDEEDAGKNSTQSAPESQNPISLEMPTLEDDPLTTLIRLHLLLRVRLTQPTYDC
jgi:hypothetical protein